MKFPWFHKKEKPDSQPLRIEGVGEAPLTPEPDDAELAAAALLEHMCDVRGKRGDVEGKHQPSAISPQTSERHQTSDAHDARYFKTLAERMRSAHEAARLRTLRFVAFCEQELKKHDLPLKGPGSLQMLEVELMKRIDTIERVEGDLKRRWQHCLADVTVRLMQMSHADSTDLTDTETDPESP